MAYTNNVPQANQRIKDTQQPILDNFGAIQTVIAVNHVTFDDPSGFQGKHKFVEFVDQNPAPTTGANQLVMYNKLYATSGAQELFVRRGVAGTEVPFTNSGSSLGSTGGTGYSAFASGVVMKWLTATTNGAGVAVINCNTAFPGSTPIAIPNGIYSVQLASVGNTHVTYLAAGGINLATGDITINTSVASRSFIIWIIGLGA